MLGRVQSFANAPALFYYLDVFTKDLLGLFGYLYARYILHLSCEYCVYCVTCMAASGLGI